MPRAHFGGEWPVLFGVPEALGLADDPLVERQFVS
jgi:hypothetical protein